MKYLVVGGGLSGLVAAHAILDSNLSGNITIIEKSSSLGGLLAGKMYPKQNLYFDIGTHIFQETGQSEIDKFLLNAVTPKDLIHFPVGKGDLAGVVFNGKLQNNSHFPDLRISSQENKIFSSVCSHIKNVNEIPIIDTNISLSQGASSRFGTTFTDEVIGPIFEHVFKQSIKDMSSFSLLLSGWTRVILDDLDSWSARSKNEKYRSLVAIPEQRLLPQNLHHGRRSFYSRNKGSSAFIDGLAENLLHRGVEIKYNSTISSINQSNLHTTIHNPKDGEINYKPDGIIFTTGVIGASKVMGIEPKVERFKRPMPHWVLDVLLDEPCESDLSYILGLDKGCDWYRVTNYRAITGDESDRRLTIEILGNEIIDSETFPSACVHQLFKLGLIRSPKLEFVNVRKLYSGFPNPTMSNFRGYSELTKELAGISSKRILFGGVGSRDGLFFQNEIIKDIYSRVRKFI